MGGYRTFFDGDTSRLEAGSDSARSSGNPELDRLLTDVLKKQLRAKAGIREQRPFGSEGGSGRSTRVAAAPVYEPIRRERPAPQQMNPNEGKIPIYTKLLSGFNMSGRVKAQPWEEGAAFSGYAPPGYNPYPDKAIMGAVEGFSSGLTPQADVQPAASGGGGAMGPGADFERARLDSARKRSDREYDERVEKAEAQQAALRSSYLGG